MDDGRWTMDDGRWTMDDAAIVYRPFLTSTTRRGQPLNDPCGHQNQEQKGCCHYPANKEEKVILSVAQQQHSSDQFCDAHGDKGIGGKVTLLLQVAPDGQRGGHYGCSEKD